MRIMFCHRPGGAFGYITDGMINALRDKGHTVIRWDGDLNNWFSFNPELYVGSSGHRQPIPKNHSAKIALHVNPYGPVEIGGINENQNAINWVLQQKPNCVFGYGFEQDRLLWNYWTERHGITWVPMPTAGDAVTYKLKNFDYINREYDVVYLGGFWPYKGITISSYLLPALNGLKYSLYGWGDWPVGYSNGILPDDKVCDLFNSGRVGPCISEGHTHTHGIDVPERVFKIILCGMVAIHDPVPALLQHIPSLVIAQSPSDYKDLINYYVNNRDLAAIRQSKQYKEVIENHTYHHRMSALLNAVGFVEQAKNMLT